MHAGLPYENCGRQAVKSHIGAEGGGCGKTSHVKKYIKMEKYRMREKRYRDETRVYMIYGLHPWYKPR